jgi:glyoxylase-like metal-dependent hydrolase (beta-lactamase superfamily II)
MATNIIRVGNVEIMMLSDGMLEFDLCNFFPTIPEGDWREHESHLTEEHKIRFNLGSYLIRADGRTILVDTGLGPRPKDTPDVPRGTLLRDFEANGVRPDEVDMVVMTHLHRDHVGWNLTDAGGRWVPTFPGRATGSARRTGRRAISRTSSRHAFRTHPPVCGRSPASASWSS